MTAGARVLVALAGAALLGGCGGDTTTLERADEAMGKLERAEISIGVVARAGSPDEGTAGPVGFTMAGRFDTATGSELPVLDLTYTRLLGDREEVVTVQSDGTRMAVRNDGVRTEVPPGQARRLAVAGDDRPAGLGELGVSGWVTEATESEGPTVDGVATRRVTGPVDGADLVSDLAVLADQVSGQRRAPTLDEEAKRRVRARVRSGDVEVLVDDNDLPRRIHATVDFGAPVAPELERALGPYAGASLEVTLEIRGPGQRVAPPDLG